MPISVEEYLAAQPDAVKNLTAGNDYSNSIYNQAAKLQAGQQYAQGNYNDAANTLASRGDIANAQVVQQAGQTTSANGMKYIQTALPVFQKIAQVHSADGPQAQGQALAGAFDHIAPEAKQLTGVSDQVLMNIRQSLLTDPQGTLDRLQASIPIEDKQVGDTLFRFQGPNKVGEYNGEKYITANPDQNVLQLNGPSSNANAPTQSAQTNGTPVAPSATANGQTQAAQVPPQGQRAGFFQQALGVPVTITSADRSQSHNAAVGGVSDSAHLQPGMADDIVPQGMSTTQAATQLASNLSRAGIPFDQIIDEGDHVHVSFDPQGRGQVLQKTDAGYSNLSVPANGPPRQLPQGQPTAANPVTAPSTQPVQQPRTASGAQVVYQGNPAFRDPTAAEKAAHPGLSQIAANGEFKYEPATTQQMQNVTPDTLNYFADQYNATGQLPPLGMGGAAFKTAILQAAAQRAQGNGLSGADIAARGADFKANAASLNRMSTQRAQIGAYEGTAENSLNLALSLNGKASATSGVPIFNSWIQAGRKSVQGDAQVSQFNDAVQTFTNEYAKIVSGSTNGGVTSDAARQHAEQLLSTADTPEQFQAEAQILQKEMGYRINNLDVQIARLHGQLSGRGSATSTQSPSQRNLPVMQTPADARKLAPGTHFLTPDGRELVR